jgi:hypothetical protein
LPIKGKGIYTCPHTGSNYELNGDQLLKIW